MLLKLLKTLLFVVFLICSTLLVLDYQTFVKHQKSNSSKHVNQALNSILNLNVNLRDTISKLLIDNRESLNQLIKQPENSELVEKLNSIFVKNLPSYYSFTLADESGNLLTDHFFEKVGRLCRQDIRNFAVDESSNWLSIHPGPDAYHYDLMIPWVDLAQIDNTAEINEESPHHKSIIFIGFNIDSLVNILKANEIPGMKLYIVRSDKNNLIEISSQGSRDSMKGVSFLGDKIQYNSSHDIEGTYWSILDVNSIPYYKLYFEQVLIKKISRNDVTLINNNYFIY